MLFDSLKIKNLALENRTVFAPICTYKAQREGFVEDFHIAHYLLRAFGQVGLIIQEATAVSRQGRISEKDLGIWDDAHIEGLKDLVARLHKSKCAIGIQINHAGRKTLSKNTVAPSAIKYYPLDVMPLEMTKKEINQVISDFKQAARRAHEAGYDFLEVDAGRGYLLAQFLSPLSNLRKDEYGDRTKLIKEVVIAVRQEWPIDKPLSIRFSAFEYHEEGLTQAWLADLIAELIPLGLDVAHIVTGGNIFGEKVDEFPGYQLAYAKYIKEKTGIITIGGGKITDLELAERAVVEGSCDLVYFGGLLLRQPHYFIHHGPSEEQTNRIPEAYKSM